MAFPGGSGGVSASARAALRWSLCAGMALAGCRREDAASTADCLELLREGFRPIASDRQHRFLGKVQENTASCRGGERALQGRALPWVDWSRYWGTGDASSKGRPGSGEDRRGVSGAVLDLEYQRLELIKFNLFDNRTYKAYVQGRAGAPGPSLKVWPEMRLSPRHPSYAQVGGGGEQLCGGELIRHRTLTGICNDLRNPAMGASGEWFGRILPFESTFPDLGQDPLARNRHGDRLGELLPDPQRLSRELFTRAQSRPEQCNAGLGLPGDAPGARCDYRKADTFNVLAAFWIQFMTHDWFSHLEEGRNAPELMPTGCADPKDAARLDCRPDDRMDRALVAEQAAPGRFEEGGRSYLTRAYKTTRNTVTAWWDASQIYGYDETSRRRVKRDPADRARLLLLPAVAGDPRGYLPPLGAQDPMDPAWAGQEATAFPDNWNIGLSFYHNVFAREHDAFVDAFRRQAAQAPGDDSGLRDPRRPERVIRNREVGPDELFEVARLVVAAEIAKIHTIEWTTQLLYDEPLALAMNANWNGLFGSHPLLSAALAQVVDRLGAAQDVERSNQWYSVFASGPGIVGLGSRVYADGRRFSLLDGTRRDLWDLSNPEHVNGGTNHFGSPFNFPEEFVTVYRLHPLVPDLVEYRELGAQADHVQKRVPVVDTFRGRATPRLRAGGLANWALSLGRQRCGALTLENHPRFLQDLPMPRERTATGRLDVAALDILRDRERGVPRFNELRRQLGLRQLTGFDDFMDPRLPADSPERARQAALVRRLRALYGQHRCDAGKPISTAQLQADGAPVDDCLGHPNGSLVDDVEDLDAVVGWLAEPVRPHGFAISETQFQVFILEASRRLFSDRFFTSSFRPEFYSTFGLRWVQDNGPDGKLYEAGEPNGHKQEVSPLKRVLLRTLPELQGELAAVVNVFDPWARARGEYYAADWKPRAGAESDEAFRR